MSVRLLGRQECLSNWEARMSVGLVTYRMSVRLLGSQEYMSNWEARMSVGLVTYI
jgi:hypothetical protein